MNTTGRRCPPSVAIGGKEYCDILLLLTVYSSLSIHFPHFAIYAFCLARNILEKRLIAGRGAIRLCMYVCMYIASFPGLGLGTRLACTVPYIIYS